MDLIPENLRRSLEDGQVVFFCGAGVSMPAGLPSFKGLVENILTDLLPTPEGCKPGSTESLAWKAFGDMKLDEALDILEAPSRGGYEQKDVRARVRHHLTHTRTKTLNQHYVLARLSDLDTSKGRLVTTNFDHLFERAIQKLKRGGKTSHKLDVHIAPALPPAKPRAWHGLTYLHGKLGHSPNDERLVLTMADFGTAYLLEGWARRFVVELFRHYHVVFIGYRVEDPTVRYLVSALAAAREDYAHFREAYVFAAYDGGNDSPSLKEDIEQEWKLKGLIPLAYDNSTNDHSKLWLELADWADDHRQGILGRQRKVTRLAQFPPEVEDDPTVQELVWALKDSAAAKYFANLPEEERPHPGWIKPLQESGLFSLPVSETSLEPPISVPLVSRTISDYLDHNEITFQLARWISTCIDSQETVDWALSQGGVLHWTLRRLIRHQLRRGGIRIRPALRKIWQVLSDDQYAHELSAKNSRPYLTYPRLGRGNTYAVRIFLNRLRPIPVFKFRSPYFLERSERDPDRPSDWCAIDMELVGVDYDHEIDEFRKRAEDWEDAMAFMAHDITARLKDAMDWLNALSLASLEEDLTHIEYRSISPHEQNAHAAVWTQLIGLTRDSYDALVDNGDHSGASCLARYWQGLPYPVFRRLSLYACTGGRNA